MNTTKNNEPWYAAGDPWVLTQHGWSPDKNFYFETIFTQSNGYMGIRGYTEESNGGVEACREGYLAGVFGHVNEAALKQIRVDYEWPMLSMITLPELFACDMVLNGESFSLSLGKVISFSRSLNMRNGVLSRQLVWESPKGNRTHLQFDRFLSAAVTHLAMQQITVTPENWEGTAVLNFGLDGAYPTYFRCGDRSFPHPPQDILLNQKIEVHGKSAANLTFETKGTKHLVSIASVVEGGDCTSLASSPKELSQMVTLTLKQGGKETVLHSVAVVSSRDDVQLSEIPGLSSSIARDAIQSGYGKSLAASEVVWDHRWATSDITIDGPARDQAYIRYSSFSMLQMAPFHTDKMSIPARAYAYNRYHGLYYWDSETFLMPYYLHTHPEVAENLLAFRHRTLDGARRTARHLKSTGACFPWMTDSDDGNEQGPWGIGDYLWHQNADIAYAIDQYVEATGDIGFMVAKGLEMITDSARFWMSRVEEDASGVVHLNDTVGPDELDKHGKDNGYTSLMARRHLRLAARWTESLRASHPAEVKALFVRLGLTDADIAAWVRAADRMAAPMVAEGNFPLQDEFLLAKKPLSFEGMTADEAFAMRHTHRVVKQSDIILVMYLLQDEFTVEQMRAAYDFYEPMCLHYSSLSYNTHSILATKIGRDGVAYDYFMKAAGLDLDDLRGATGDGLHAAALGGTWQTIAYGFLGMRLVGNGIAFEPHFPEAWKSVDLRIAYGGYSLHLVMDHKIHRISVEGEGGLPGKQVSLNGEAHDLSHGLTISTKAPAR
jgi:alpha,alpha-trehalose phosphorylase